MNNIKKLFAVMLLCLVTFQSNFLVIAEVIDPSVDEVLEIQENADPVDETLEIVDREYSEEEFTDQNTQKLVKEEILETTTTTEDIKEEIATSTDQMSMSFAPSLFSIENTEIATNTAKLIIKKDSVEIFNQDVDISDEKIKVDASGSSYDVERNNVLGLIAYADSISESFNLTNISYYLSFDSFLINCLNVPSIQESNLCYNWQYVVDDQYPFVGADDYVLNGGETIYLYFGQPKRILFPDLVFKDVEFTASLEKYNYQNDSWSALTGQTIGIFNIPNSTEWWATNEIATSSVDVNGQVKFTLTEIGEFKIGIQEDYYYPSYDLIFGTSTATTTESATTTATTTTSGSGGGSSNSSKFNLEKAINFLLLNQQNNGSFGGDLYTDWVAVGLGANDKSNSSLKNYLKSDSISSELTEYLRRAMALMSVGLDPQKDYQKYNLVEKILAEFDGNQFGDSGLVNDDIFSVLVLSNLGYDYDDKEINKTIEFILNQQNGNGSWDGVDLTSAGIQALIKYKKEKEVSTAIENAKKYLESQKDSNGSWSDNAYSTAWAILALNSLNEDEKSFGNNNDPFEYLGSIQNSDGGLLKDDSLNNRIWATAYAIASASGKDWNEIMKDFRKIEIEDISSGNSDSNSGNSQNDSENSEENIEEEILSQEIIENQNAFENREFFSIVENISTTNQNQISEESVQNSDKSDQILQDILDEVENSANASDAFDLLNWWYLAGAIIFALIALLNFRK